MLIARMRERAKTGFRLVTGAKLDVFDRLRIEHMKMELQALELWLVRDEERQARLLRTLSDALDQHMRFEERLLYPACRAFAELADTVDRAHADHQLAKNALLDLKQMIPGTVGFARLVLTLIKVFEQHLQREESHLFPLARRLLGAEISERTVSKEVRHETALD